MKPRKPKNIAYKPKKWVDVVSHDQIAIIGAMGAVQVAKIQSSIVPKYMLSETEADNVKAIKKTKIISGVLNTASAIIKIANGQKQRRFNATGRYVR